MVDAALLWNLFMCSVDRKSPCGERTAQRDGFLRSPSANLSRIIIFLIIYFIFIYGSIYAFSIYCMLIRCFLFWVRKKLSLVFSH